MEIKIIINLLNESVYFLIPFNSWRVTFVAGGNDVKGGSLDVGVIEAGTIADTY